MMHDIQTALSRLVSKASQLIENVTTNVAESWMHIRSKYDGGKVINRSQSGSWEHRCMGAGLQQNKGKEWGPELWRQMTNSSPNEVFSNTARHSAKEVESDRKRKAKEEVMQRDEVVNTRALTTWLQLTKHSVDMIRVFSLKKLMTFLLTTKTIENGIL